MLFIVSELEYREARFITSFNRCIGELDQWDNLLVEKKDLGYTLLAIRIQKELRRFKDIYLLPATG